MFLGVDEISYLKGLMQRETFEYTCSVHDIALLIHARVFTNKRGRVCFFWKMPENCRQGHVPLISFMIDTLVLPLVI